MPGMKRKWLWLLALAISVIIGAGYLRQIVEDDEFGIMESP
jgi:hypothetical protein